MTRYVVGSSACDDSTYAVVDLTDEQAAGFRLALEAINPRADYACKPSLYLRPEDEARGTYEHERAIAGTDEDPEGDL